ncbi:MAG: AAA family ATPase, partial [Bacteroidota bacterium]
ISSNQYQSDWKIREVIRKVIRSLAHTGKYVIVGRAGAQIARDLQNSLHIRLVAPVSWRIEQVMETYEIPRKDAAKRVKEMDLNRNRLLKAFSKDAECDYCYDVFFNMKYLTYHQVISDIIHLMQLKKLI